jgi:hypothetical protein
VLVSVGLSRRLKICRWQHRPGSIPGSGTSKIKALRRMLDKLTPVIFRSVFRKTGTAVSAMGDRRKALKER